MFYLGNSLFSSRDELHIRDRVKLMQDFDDIIAQLSVSS